MALPVRFSLPPSHNTSAAASGGGAGASKKIHGRKALDFVPPTLRNLQYSKIYASPKEYPAVENDVLFAPFVLAPRPQFKDPLGCVCTRLLRMSSNKQRSPVMQVTYMPNGNRALTGAKSGEFTLWNCQTMSFETVLQAHDNPVRRMLWSHDNSWLISADELGYIKYWQSNMMNVKAFQAHSDVVGGLSFAPLSTKFASGSDDGTIAVWDFETTREVLRWKSVGADVKCVAWHPKTSLIACGLRDMQQPMRLYDARTKDAIGTLYYHKGSVPDARWSPFNSNWLLSCSQDGLVKLFDLRLMKVLQTFRGHRKEVTCISWHPVYENLFVSGGFDGSLLYWIYGVEKEVGRLDNAHEQAVWSAEWHPLGHMVISTSNDTTTRFWTRLRPGEYDGNAARGYAGAGQATAAGSDAVAFVDQHHAVVDDYDVMGDHTHQHSLAAAPWQQWPRAPPGAGGRPDAYYGGGMDENLGPPQQGYYGNPRFDGPPPSQQAQFALSSVLSRFSFDARGHPRFRGPRPSPPGSQPPFPPHHQQNQPPPFSSLTSWSRLQLLDNNSAQQHQQNFAMNMPPPNNATRPPSAGGFAGEARFPPPPQAFLGRLRDNAEQTKQKSGAGGDEPDGSVKSAEMPLDDAGKSLLPDPAAAAAAAHQRQQQQQQNFDDNRPTEFFSGNRTDGEYFGDGHGGGLMQSRREPHADQQRRFPPSDEFQNREYQRHPFGGGDGGGGNAVRHRGGVYKRGGGGGQRSARGGGGSDRRGQRGPRHE